MTPEQNKGGPCKFVFKEVRIPKAAAQKMRAREIYFQKQTVAHLKNELREAKKDLLKLEKAPLQTHRTEQTTLYPGDNGYEKAPDNPHWGNYRGEFKWRNPQSKALE
jgi:hypothetical protein